MRVRNRRFQRRRRLRLWRQRSILKKWGLFERISLWWNRRKFYTFHKDEVITEKHARTFPLVANEEEADEVEWNNESESEDPEYSDTASKHDEKASSQAGSDFGDHDDGGTLVTIEEDAPFDDSLETIEEEVPLDESPRLGSKPKISPMRLSQPPPPLSSPPAVRKSIRNGAADSISGSLESMDSLVSSQWDPEDDASTITPLVTNTHPTDDAFFVEHVRFLQIQTQPRKVEEVYRDNSKERPANE
jgi:hypothetical protein